MNTDPHVTLRLDQPLWQWAYEREMTVSDVIREAIDQHVAMVIKRDGL